MISERLRIKKESSQRGFTILELLIVIFIITLIASVIIINVSSSRTKARDARRKSDLLIIASALESYFVENKVYPNGNCLLTNATSGNTLRNELVNNGFLTTLPVDPQSTASPPRNYIYITNNYYSCVGGTNQPNSPGFVIAAFLERFSSDPDATTNKYFPPTGTSINQFTRSGQTYNYWVTSR